MKIAVIGAQGVGKSTLCRAAYNKIKGLRFVKETIRDCPYPINEKSDFRTQWWAMSHQILAEEEARTSKAELILMDRSLIDIAVFTSLIHKRNPQVLSLAQRNLIFESLSNWLSLYPYKKVIHLKVDPLIWQHREIHDGFRTSNLEWFLAIEKEMDLVLTELEIKQNTQYIQFDNNIELALSIRRFVLELEATHKSLLNLNLRSDIFHSPSIN